MSTFTRAAKKFARFVVAFGKEERGEDLTDSSSHLSNAGKAVIAACVITGVAGGAAALTTSQTAGADRVMTGISGRTGAPVTTAAPTPTAFEVGH